MLLDKITEFLLDNLKRVQLRCCLCLLFAHLFLSVFRFYFYKMCGQHYLVPRTLYDWKSAQPVATGVAVDALTFAYRTRTSTAFPNEVQTTEPTMAVQHYT